VCTVYLIAHRILSFFIPMSTHTHIQYELLVYELFYFNHFLFVPELKRFSVFDLPRISSIRYFIYCISYSITITNYTHLQQLRARVHISMMLQFSILKI